MTRLLRAARRRRGDAGVTMIELLVVMMLLAVIGGLTTKMFTAAARSSTQASSRVRDATVDRVALDAMTKSLRTAIRIDGATPAFVSAGPYDVSFYADMHTALPDGTFTGPELVHYWVDWTKDVLYQDTTPAIGKGKDCPDTYCWPASGLRRRVLARNLLDPQPVHPSTATSAIFTYGGVVDPAGAAATLSTDAGGNIAADTLDAIQGVEVSLSTRTSQSTTAPDTTVVDRVTLTNTNVKSAADELSTPNCTNTDNGSGNNYLNNGNCQDGVAK